MNKSARHYEGTPPAHIPTEVYADDNEYSLYDKAIFIGKVALTIAELLLEIPKEIIDRIK